MVGTQNQKCFRKFGKLVTKVLTVILTFEDPHPLVTYCSSANL